MATLTKGKTFGATEEVTAAKLHQLIDSGTCTGIVNADIDAGASIVDSKLATINTAGKVDGGALTGLANVPVGAGALPIANVSLASQAQAEAGAVNTVLMTPLRVSQAITALQSSVSFKVGSFTRDLSTASGTQSITGVGFTPSVVIIFGSKNGTETMCQGFMSSTAQGCTTMTNATETTSTLTDRVIFVDNGGADASYAVYSAMGADGFTLSWTKGGAHSGTYTAIYLAVG